ncbi:MAG TPA: methyltransferase domain-containing protein [Streptosporangiaceae bacterium]|jgi:SAM-dependent methyltransferase
MDETALALDAREYYERGEEEDRLDRPIGALEFERTRQIVARRLPPPPATVADIGGGPGRYARWLAGLGYQVRHRDLMPLHVRQAQAGEHGAAIESRLADARELDLPDESVDAVLLLGPLYHLERRADRVRALAEARRVVRPGGPVFAAAISRWAPRLDGVLRHRIDLVYSQVDDMVTEVERTGVMAPLYAGSFCGFAHRPGQLRAELTAAGLRVTDLVSVEGPAMLLADLAERLADPDSRRVVLETATALERIPELVGVGPHFLASAERPAG